MGFSDGNGCHIKCSYRSVNCCRTKKIIRIGFKKAGYLLKMAGEVKTILRQADAVCFDVDSTVIREEGIDELAKFCNKGDEVAKL